jgi:hypothetical protein
VKPCFPVLARTGGNPRITPGSSVVIVASLLEGVAWYAGLPCARLVVDILRRAQRLRGISVFVNPTFFGISFSCLSFVFSFGRACAVCPSHGSYAVSVLCYINIAGRKPISRRGDEEDLESVFQAGTH